MERAFPEVEAVGQNVCLSAESELGGVAGLLVLFGKSAPRILFRVTLRGEFESELQAAVDLEAVVDHFLNRDFILGSLHGNAAHTGVDVAGVLADDDIVDVFGSLVGERRNDAGIELDRTQIDVLVESETELEENALLKDSGSDFGRSDCAEENRIELLQPVDCVVGKNHAGLEIVFTAPLKVGESHFKSVLFGNGLKDLDAFRHDFGTRSVARKSRDLVNFRHFLNLSFQTVNRPSFCLLKLL